MASVDPGTHEWYRTIWAWHVAFGAVAALTGGLFLVDGGVDAGRRYAALTLLVVLCSWYAATGARALHREPGGLGLVYLLGAAPLTVALFAVTPVGATMLFLLYPHLWALLPLRRAIAGTAAMVVLVAAATLVSGDLASDHLLSALVLTVAALPVGLGLGLWITRIIAQSTRRAELVAQLAAARAELAEVSRQAGVLAERERLARDIHDTLAQGFTSVLLLLDASELALDRDQQAVRRYIERARQTARENLAETRSVVAALTPPLLRNTSLADAVRQLADRVMVATGVEQVVTVTGSPRPLQTEREVVLLRAAQEALANVCKHAAATRVEITLDYHDGGATLQVTDDGRGFDPAAPTAGFGLSGMRERVAQVGGTVEVQAAPTEGTTVRFEVTP